MDKNLNFEEQRFKTRTYPDGSVVFVDPGTRVAKKNRRRHVKDGAPKSMRGKRNGEIGN